MRAQHKHTADDEQAHGRECDSWRRSGDGSHLVSGRRPDALRRLRTPKTQSPSRGCRRPASATELERQRGLPTAPGTVRGPRYQCGCVAPLLDRTSSPLCHWRLAHRSPWVAPTTLRATEELAERAQPAQPRARLPRLPAGNPRAAPVVARPGAARAVERLARAVAASAVAARVRVRVRAREAWLPKTWCSKNAGSTSAPSTSERVKYHR